MMKTRLIKSLKKTDWIAHKHAPKPTICYCQIEHNYVNLEIDYSKKEFSILKFFHILRINGSKISSSGPKLQVANKHIVPSVILKNLDAHSKLHGRIKHKNLPSFL